MARAKLMSAIAYDQATFERDKLADPVIRVLGELPGPAEPFNLHRVYKGPQGVVEESILLVDPDNVVVWERPYKFIELRGEMFEDLFRSEIREPIEISSAGEHKLVFLVDGGEAGRVPVFIDAAESASSMGVLDDAVETALKKGSIVWLSIPQPDGTTATRPAWYVQQGTTLFVIKGEGEQQLPNIEQVDEVELTVKSKDINASIAVVKAKTRVVRNDSDEFDRIATIGLGTRLNLPDGQGALDRWRSGGTMIELTPQFP